MTYIRKSVHELRLGMYVAELDRSWLESPFLFQGFVLEREEDIRTLTDLCRYVHVDPERSTIPITESNSRPAPSAGTKAFTTNPSNTSGPKDTQALLHATAEVKDKRIQTHDYLLNLFDDIRLGHTVDSEEVKERVKGVVETITRFPNVAIWLTQMKNRDEYTSLHCLNVCVLTVAFCHHLGYSQSDLETIAIGALLHDIGKAKIPDAVLNKPGALSDDEWRVMKQHPEIGHQLMAKSGGIPDVALHIILGHHRRITGAGYPDKFPSRELDTPILASAIADVYDAMTSDRPYHRGLAADRVLRDMQKSAKQTFGSDLMDAFIRCVGIFPVGSAVELGNGFIGMVISPGRKAKLLPQVVLFRDAKGIPLAQQQLVDLSLAAAKDPGGNWHIHRVVEPALHQISQRELTLGNVNP
ncbi:putative nucleotidyltransferase with HDIG domain [Natronospira proteinivora]|uniref:Nucleotidyltransferase with HDIG domain n=1 Tax=Natronospira proteinivora TaxID=1807133 RepID=A0ABT1G745_9GAMM|nr:HD-GYP domain-containing protein [Natronospira proteinivora]MCP1727114.1 putative nucleotidyltransferase with HDIG domain [Natronospira proteinivora]